MPTDKCTAAWGGVERKRSWHTPRRRQAWTTGLSARPNFGGYSRMSFLSTASIWPSRRSTVMQSGFTKLRSRGAKDLNPSWEPRACSTLWYALARPCCPRVIRLPKMSFTVLIYFYSCRETNQLFFFEFTMKLCKDVYMVFYYYIGKMSKVVVPSKTDWVKYSDDP